MFHVWIDQDLCTGDGLCTDHCPDVFILLEDGISYVRDPCSTSIGNDPGGRGSLVEVHARLEQQVIDAAVACPGECIFIEVDDINDRSNDDESSAATGSAREHEYDRHDEDPGGSALPRLGEFIDQSDVRNE